LSDESNSGALESSAQARTFDYRQWSAMAATLLWRELRIDAHLYETHRHRFDALLNSNPNGILDNVKKLSILTGLTTSNATQKQQVTSALLRLFSALPQDHISSLHSVRLAIHPDVICVLLGTQSLLRELRVLIDEQSPDGLPGGIHARDSLSQMESLTVDVFGLHHQTYRGMGAWFAHTHTTYIIWTSLEGLRRPTGSKAGLH